MSIMKEALLDKQLTEEEHKMTQENNEWVIERDITHLADMCNTPEEFAHYLRQVIDFSDIKLKEMTEKYNESIEKHL